MTAILGWSSMMRSGSLDESAMNTGIAAIEQSARMQTQLIDDLLDVSRIIAGKLSLEPRPIDLGSIGRAAVQTVSPAAEKKLVRIEIVLPAAPLSMLADAGRLHQIVTNLLGNAIKFTLTGGCVRVALHRDGEEAVVSVVDDGIGIRADFLPYVFDRFTQADPSFTRGYSGLGLGLAIVRHLVELHGGEVEAKSDGPEQGSAFIVRLPLRETVIAPESESRSFDAAMINLSGSRVVVVEDEPFAREMMKVVLMQYGADVRACGSVAEAFYAIAEERPDVVVTDIAMPVEDGFSLLQKLRVYDAEHAAKTQVIAVSALSRADDRSRIMLAGFDDYLQKPVQPVRLAAAVARKLFQA
jgi:CheY-like chemotaxis protein